MAMMTVYFDDSGTAPDQQIAIAACYVGTAEQWQEFTRNWDEAAKDEGFRVFHMAEFVAGKPPFESWDSSKKKRVLTRLCNIIDTRARGGFATAVTKSDYDHVVTGHFRRYCGNFHYTFAVRQNCGKVAVWRKKNAQDSTMRYVFDWMESGQAARREIEYVLDGAMELDAARPLIGYSFERRSSIRPLQAADILAWTVYQQMQKHLSTRPVPWEADMAYDLLKHSRCPLDDGYFVRENLTGWAQAEIAGLVKRLQAQAEALRRKK